MPILHWFPTGNAKHRELSLYAFFILPWDRLVTSLLSFFQMHDFSMWCWRTGVHHKYFKHSVKLFIRLRKSGDASDCNWRFRRLEGMLSSHTHTNTPQPLGHRQLFDHHCRKWLFLCQHREGFYLIPYSPAACYTSYQTLHSWWGLLCSVWQPL